MHPIVLRKMLCSVRALLFGFLFVLGSGYVHAQTSGTITPASADPTARPPYGIAVKRPLVAVACKGCPWGAMAYAAAAAIKFYGYDLQVCWVCWGNLGPREVADKTKPTMPPGESLPWYIEPPPDGVPDLGITSDMNLTDAYLGRGVYAGDKKERKNYRVIATFLQPNYMMIAVSEKSGIKSLFEIKDRREPTRIWTENEGPAVQTILKYYGINTATLAMRGGGIIHPLLLERQERASADVYIGGAVLVNTPEQHTWYEATQLSDLKFLQMDDQLIDQLAKIPGFSRGVVPMGFLRGVD